MSFNDPNPRKGPTPTSPSWLADVLGFAAILVVFVAMMPARLWRPNDVLGINENIQIAEAQAWWNGRLDLSERKWDTALHEGKVYSHFPPMFSLVSALLVPFFGGVPHWFIAFFVVLPVPILAYALFRRRTGSALSGFILAFGLVFGTSLHPVLDKTLRGTSPYFVNQTLATIGLLLMLIDSFGKQRVRLTCLGLVIAGLSRQLTLAYAIPLFFITSRVVGVSGRGAGEPTGDGGSRVSRLAYIVGAMFVVMGTASAMNFLKFGHPLDSGYGYVYNDRTEDAFSRDARAHGIFSARYVPRNLYYANLGAPELHRIEVGGKSEWYLRPNRMGTGIWWTTPLLAWMWIDWRRLWADRTSQLWLIAAALVIVGLTLFHGTGSDQRGFNRFSLDYVPVLFGLIAPRCVSGRRWWITATMIAWSVIYFRVLLAWPHVRVW